MKTRSFFAVLSILGLLASCAQMNPQPMDMSQAAQKARSGPDQSALAKRYEDAAKEMQAKVQEHKKQLEEYEYHSYLYGKQAQNLQAHCRGLIRYYEQAAEANRDMAEIHRQLAAELR
ncbi:MAG: hypothetical protein ABS69_00230 [Nitrosomonadales bacterium SCN 54-20]|nr:MAG: hypothetical protein ABS69_00230 [Nitrosomonadales bacterium SCN 54-20]